MIATYSFVRIRDSFVIFTQISHTKNAIIAAKVALIAAKIAKFVRIEQKKRNNRLISL